MSSKDTGGPAFPVTSENFRNSQSGVGMTLRDYFAAKTMQGMLSDANAIIEETGEKLTLPDDAESIAEASYIMADAMLKARAA